MASKTVRRRLHQGDINGTDHEHLHKSGSDSLSEPLLRNSRCDESPSEAHDHANYQDFQEEQRKESHHWTYFCSQLIIQCAQCLANIIICSGSLLRRCLPFPSITHNGQDRKDLPLFVSPLQQERLRNLQQRLEVPYNGTCLDHQDALRQLWKLAYPNRDIPSLKSERWKEMGWQGPDPSTDFRGCGFISLENLLFFAKKYPDSFQRLLHKQEGERAEWEYPFAVAGINISFMLVQMLDLQSGGPTTMAGIHFLELLGQDEMAFDNLYCVAFQMMDAQWLAKRASYMEFNEVLKSTKAQLERELALEDVSSIKDLPAYNLLKR
eukprot:TRINITY_DN4985_c0_g1_i1.p1 TRINITY_DN4985_c0_g1~~TRINITY_DN4985_c0_g1_i1.p1  ORF type:complete len:323 (-),score=63.37 TRINITY_DN4985_c0_g1_i1:495-1463(-)